jgi:hypothetical protein
MIRSPLVHGVAAAFKARAQGAPVLIAGLPVHGIGPLIVLVLPNASQEGTSSRTYRRTLAGIAADRATDGTDRGSAGRASD